MSIDGKESSERSDSSTACSENDVILSDINDGERNPAAVIHICPTYTLFIPAGISDGENVIETSAASGNNAEGIAELKAKKKYHQSKIRGE